MDDYHFGAYQGADAQGIANFGRPTGIPRFYTRSVPDLVASREKGMPISKAVDFIEILTPGERDTVDREVKPSDKFQWAREWAAYKASVRTHLFLTAQLKLPSSVLDAAPGWASINPYTIASKRCISRCMVIGPGGRAVA